MASNYFQFYILFVLNLSVHGWLFGGNDCTENVACYGRKLHELYTQEIAPIEQDTFFNELKLPALTESHFTNEKAILLLVGQYSSGKTTFVNFLTQQAYSNQFISIAASTAEFTFISAPDSEDCTEHSCASSSTSASSSVLKQHDSDAVPTTEEIEVIDDPVSNAQAESHGKFFVMSSKSPFNVFADFSSGQVVKDMKAVFVDSEILRKMYIVDTPGILAENKESCLYMRFYEALYFESDLIVFLFDPYKPSDIQSANTVFALLKPSLEKVRFVINKVDALGLRSLLDVYGAIQQNLGRARIFETLELSRFFFTSLWDKECQSSDASVCAIIKKDKQELLDQIEQMNNIRRKIESKIKSLSERIDLLNRHINFMDRYASINCDCGMFSCDCSDQDERDQTRAYESKAYACYHKNVERLIKMMARKNPAGVKKLQGLIEANRHKIVKAKQKLNVIAETLEQL